MWADRASRVMWDATERFRAANRRKMHPDQLGHEAQKHAKEAAEQDEECIELKAKWDKLRAELEEMSQPTNK